MSDNDLIRRGDAIAAVRAHDFRWEAVEAIAALPAVTVGIKPLVWRSNGKGRVCADTPFGLYEIEHGRYGMRLLHSGSFMQDDLQGIEAAKAAAQADYEARILAALDLTPAPDPIRIADEVFDRFEAKGAVSEAFGAAEVGEALRNAGFSEVVLPDPAAISEATDEEDWHTLADRVDAALRAGGW